MLKPTSRLFVWVTALAIVVSAAFTLQTQTESAHADEPVITYMYPEEGQVFSESLRVIQICFEEPIDVRDLPPRDDGDFEFNLRRPSGFSTGMRIVFQANGYGVAVYPGFEDDDPIGEWEFFFEVRDRDSLDPISRTVIYEIAETGDPIITPTPQMCPSDGSTVAPSAQPTGGPDGTPSNGGGGPDEDDGDSDALLLSLLAIGAAGGAGVLLLLGYLFRRRIGWWLHDPKDEPDSADRH